MRLIAPVLALLVAATIGGTFPAAAETRPQRIILASGKSFVLQVPLPFSITLAAEGARRARFFAQAPDGRIFVTDLYNMDDSNRGTIHILEGFDPRTGEKGRLVPYLTGLRNPNSVAFHTDAEGRAWIYIALTDKLIRYPYHAGDMKPAGEPQTLAQFPDYGLNYKYGGWHLTRSLAFFNGKLYVAVGSSCNACIEKEDVRAAVLQMDPDGANQRVFVTGLRNAVGLKVVAGRLMATNQGADHLGDDRPEETMIELQDGADYGWPYCYQYRGRIEQDPTFKRPQGCAGTPLASITFPAHSSALGFAYFENLWKGSRARGPHLDDAHLVALQGSTKRSLKRGYKVAMVKDGVASDFITGFLAEDGTINGRPCDIFPLGRDRFLLSDDYNGAIYYVSAY